VTESICLQKKKKIDEEKEVEKKDKLVSVDGIKEESEKDNIKKEEGDFKVSIKKEIDDKLDSKINDDKIFTNNVKTEVVDPMEVDESLDDKLSKENKDELSKNKDNSKDEILSEQAKKVMFHNIMDNSHIPLEEDMEFELYMYKFLCMQFGIENVDSENMPLPIMLDYFGSSDGVTYNNYDRETSKLSIKVDNDAKNKKDNNSISDTTRSNNNGKKLWKVHIDNHCCTIDRKTLVS